MQTNGGSGYRVDAAAAKFAKTIAAEHYGHSGPIHGYTWGGSGGSYQVMGAMENTAGVWDGGVPFIVGDATSIPNNFFARAYGRLLLSDRAAAIADAVGPGSRRDPYAELDRVQQDVLRELTQLGVPLAAWEDYRYVLGMDAPDGLFGFAGQIKMMDPGYLQDFWSVPGYLGTEQSPLGDRIRAAVVDVSVPVTAVRTDGDNVVVTVDSAPLSDVTPYDLTVLGRDAVTVTAATPGKLVLPAATLDGVTVDVGTRVHLDNRWYVALTSYMRHQVPADPAVTAYDQYRNADGVPRYPQRPVLAGEQISRMVSGGGTHSGDLHGKVIAVASLLDTDAFPWHGDWYRGRVRSALGDGEGDRFRLWYTGNADHIAPGRTDRLIDYTGVLEQALRDLAEWAENGTAPSPSSKYTVTDGQVRAARGTDRGGIQPAVSLTVDGSDNVVVRAGQSVRLDATVDANGANEIAAQWYPEGPEQTVDIRDGAAQMSYTVHYDRPGIYYPQLRVSAARRDLGSGLAEVDNLARVRVTVIE